MEAKIQLTVTVDEARLLYEALAERVEVLTRMGFTNATEEFEQLNLMRGALKQFEREAKREEDNPILALDANFARAFGVNK